MAAAYTLTIRAGAEVRKTQHHGLGEALHKLVRKGRELEAGADERETGGTLIRKL